MLAQVNLNLDSYLRNMMRVSDTVYYRVIKNTDLQREDMARELRDSPGSALCKGPGGAGVAGGV